MWPKGSGDVAEPNALLRKDECSAVFGLSGGGYDRSNDNDNLASRQ
jgi:hypothetical protein